MQALVASDILVFRVDSHAELQIRSLSCGFDVVSCALEVLCLSCHCHFSGAGPEYMRFGSRAQHWRETYFIIARRDTHTTAANETVGGRRSPT